MVQIRTEVSDVAQEFPHDAPELPRAIPALRHPPQIIFQLFDAAAVLVREDFAHRLVDVFSRLSAGKGRFPSATAYLELRNQMEMAALKNPAILFRNTLRSSKTVGNKGFYTIFERIRNIGNRLRPILRVLLARQQYRIEERGGMTGDWLERSEI